MASENLAGTSPLPMTAGADILAHRLVKCGTTDLSCIPSVAIADVSVGVSLVGVSSGAQLPVQIAGVAKVTAKAAITIGAEVMAHATSTAADKGKCETAAGATALSVGVALQAATADGDIIMVLLHTPNVKGAANS